MSLIFDKIEMKNFVSFGNVTQTLELNNKNLHLILGENIDSDSSDQRNGTGKSSIINAISYALFGKPLVSIRLDNLINKTNERGMEVAIEFHKNGNHYRIERGRRPNKLLFYQNSTCINDDATDESQGENRKTQEEIEKTLGINYEMFKNIVVLNTYSQPFLSMPAAAQRSFIESLLGISVLSEKADVLKEQIKKTKDAITEEEFRIKAVVEANKTIENNIENLTEKSNKWEKDHVKNLTKYKKDLEDMKNVDIDEEIKLHKSLEKYNEEQASLKRYNTQLRRIDREKNKIEKKVLEYHSKMKDTESHICHSCKQTIEGESYDTVKNDLDELMNNLTIELKELDEEEGEITNKIKKLVAEKPKTSPFYSKIDDAYRHSTKMENVSDMIDRENDSENPYTSQIESLTKEGLKEVDYTALNEFTKIKEHQDFLLKLLTSNKSFIRKEIIDKNIGYLNSRLDFYLSVIGLPHQVQFQSDLDVNISEYGRELDFDNLSRGERTRLILALSWAFRDVYESLNGRINLLFIDELLDNGLDTSGAENGLRILKEMNRRMKRDVFLITHREEMHGRVDSVINVTKQNGFSSLSEAQSV